MIEIIPAIISNSYEDFEKKVKAVEPFVDRVHLDIMDGIFVQNKTIDGIGELNKIDTRLNFDVHLMVQKPQDIINAWLGTKADRFLIHIESDTNLVSLADKIHKANKQIAVVINPETECTMGAFVQAIPAVDAVQFMTVHPGDYGGAFVQSVSDKIKSFHNKYPDVKIIVDGAMHPDTAKRVVDAGASVTVLGSHIFNEGRSIKEVIEELKNSL